MVLTTYEGDVQILRAVKADAQFQIALPTSVASL